MKTEAITTIKLVAEEGKILTDGIIYGKEIYLAEDRSADEFYEITEAEYEKIIKDNMEELNNG